MNIDDFWKPFETEIDSFDKLVKIIDGVMEKAVKHKIQFAWRGQVGHYIALSTEDCH